MEINSYGGTFLGFRAITERARGSKNVAPKVDSNKEASPKIEEPPEKLVVELLTAERIMLPELQPPEKMDMLVTVLFDDEWISETFQHLRHSCKPAPAVYLFDSYMCKFKQKITLPCVGKKRFLLYISYIVSRVAEDGSINLDLRGYGFTKPINIETCKKLNQYKNQVCSCDGKKLLDMRLSYTVTASKDDGSEAMPEDVIGGRIYQTKALAGLDVMCGSNMPNTSDGNLELGNYLEYMQSRYPLDRSIDFHLSLDVIHYDDTSHKPNRSQWRALAVKDVYGNVLGRWTIVNDQGFEVILHDDTRYFFYMRYTKNVGDLYETDPNHTQIGWAYTPGKAGVADARRRCAYASKLNATAPQKATLVRLHTSVTDMFKQIDRSISKDGSMHGAIKSEHVSPKKGSYSCGCSGKDRLHFDDRLPIHYEWKTRAKIPIVNQETCGSCHAIASRYVLQSRFLIALERVRERTPELDAVLDELSHYTFDPKDVTDCSIYNQGCNGGYPYLMGKHMREFGLLTTKNANKQCSLLSIQRRYFAKEYGYISGCHQCTACQGEKLIMREVYANGPVVTAIDAAILTADYDGHIITSNEEGTNSGICDMEHHPILTGWEYTSHAVVIVGWGQENVAGRMVKYWICRNSWGQKWGINGYFKIERGKNAYGIESEAVFIDPDFSKFAQEPAIPVLHGIHQHH
ncbi:cathepsin C [Babesia ovis]|uniref:dipeptidyl-peptidase I n=1 Tax=Babesia ovis TaxID=5869 RepID=A0A9W5TEC8_BABOV|nr:cathepsin C [Babesia ovis]